MDQKICTVVARGTSGIVMYNLHECYDNGVGLTKLGVIDDANVFLVCSSSTGVSRKKYADDCLCCRYFSLFITYTPYTMYQCTRPSQLSLVGMTDLNGIDGLKGWAKMVWTSGWKCM